MLTVLIFILVLLITVIVHEWGHFFVAKRSGMLVEEFGFGIPPRLFARKKGETTYSFNALPIGGFVKIAGENKLDESIPLNRQFESKPWYLKSAVLLAGVVCNFLLAVVLFSAAYFIGLPSSNPTGVPTVLSVVPDSPISRAGIVVGDTIQALIIDGQKIDNLSTNKIHEKIQDDAKEISIQFKHQNQSQNVTIEPEQTATGKMIGVTIEPIQIVKKSLTQSVYLGAKQSFYFTTNIFSALGQLIGGIFTSNGAGASLIGPVGLVKEVGSASVFGFAYLLAFTAMISLNLAVLNVLPFPALDGGRLIIVWLEALSGRKFSSKIVGIIHASGFLLLISLMIFLTVRDVGRFF